MKLPDHFHEFLTNSVNLSQGKLDLLETKVEYIFGATSADKLVGPYVRDKIPQGSWAHETIINPQGDREFDADFLLLMDENPEWSAEPKRYLEQVCAALGRSRYAEMTKRKNRCVRVTYANDCHVDVVPYLVLPDGRKVIVNHEENDWEVTNPEGFTAWMQEKDGIAEGNLRKVIRILKFLRDHKGTFQGTRSIILTTLVGERVSQEHKAADPGYYSDVPTALVNIINDLDDWLADHPDKPSIKDPSGSGLTFDHRWDDTAYQNLRKRMTYYASKITEAFEEADEATSVELWQQLCGSGFKKPTERKPTDRFGPVPVVPVRPGRGG